MDNNQTQSLIHRILSGYQHISHLGKRYILKKPSIDLLIEADILYQQTYEDNKYGDFYLLDKLDVILFQFGVCAGNYKDVIKNLEKKIENAKKDIYKNFNETKEKTKYKRELAKLKKDLNEIQAKTHYLDFLILEKHCEHVRHEFIVANTLYHHNSDKLVFDYSNIYDYNFFTALISEISNNIIDISTFKKLATSDYWKNYYTHNKKNIFSFPASEYTEEQKALINISAMYDNIYQHPECPSEAVIEDEDALDGWMLIQKEKNEREKAVKGVKDKLGSSKTLNADKVFLPSTGSEESREAIRSLNQPEGLEILKARSAALKERGTMQEMDFTDAKKDLQEFLGKMNQQRKARKK